MDLLTLLSLTLRSLWTHKMRSSLTLLGIVIGVAAVVGLMGIGQGAQRAITGSISGLGENLITVRSGGGSGPFGALAGGGGSSGSSTPALTLADADAFANSVHAPSIVATAPELNTGGEIAADRERATASIIGTTPDYFRVNNRKMLAGEFIAHPHVEASARVIVLDQNLVDRLFGPREAVGSQVRLRGQEYRVIGIMESLGGAFAAFGNQAFVPITTAHYRLNNAGSVQGGIPVTSISVSAGSADAVRTAMEEVRFVLQLRHGADALDDFSVSSLQQAADAIQAATSILVIFLAAIAGISLLVGGIGIMNIMLVSVTERIREIGIRKALGARRRDILFQFSTEAVVLSFIGGVVGVLAGYLLAILGAAVITALTANDPGSQPLYAELSPQVTLLALGVSAGIGLFFGVYPAMRAARLQPVEALRHQ